MMKREHFNRWYNLVPYFLSVVTFEIPFQVRNTEILYMPGESLYEYLPFPGALLCYLSDDQLLVDREFPRELEIQLFYAFGKAVANPFVTSLLI